MVNKACFRKSVVHDFVWILLVIVALFISGLLYLMLNALIPILTPFGTAYNWAIGLSIITMLIFLITPIIALKPDDAKQFPTAALLLMDYVAGVMIYIAYSLSSCYYTNEFFRVCSDLPDITLFIVGSAVMFTVICPISMGYARCRGE